MITTIFFDLGSTLWDDYPMILDMWASVAELLTRRGVPTTTADMIEHSHRVIGSYSPSLTRAIVWQRLDGDIPQYESVMREIINASLSRLHDAGEFRRLNPLFDGVPEMLANLGGQYRLGVISQHFREVRQWIAHHGIEQHFQHLAVSGNEKLYKPDPRLFLGACEALDVSPEQALMVGDRLDNDIWPANRIGMTTVRVLAGPYKIQRPRYPRDLPDCTINHITELPQALSALAD